MSLTVKALLAHAQQTLQASLPPHEARAEVQYLLSEVLQCNRAWLMAHDDAPLTEAVCATFLSLVQRRAEGEPVAYIIGHREFFGLRLQVTPDTLIPRPDTETLVESALQKLAQLDSAEKQPTVLDLGTGSGAIALAIAHQCPHAKVTAVDASLGALAMARQNARELQLAHVTCVHSHWFAQLSHQRFHIIVSNPPYIEAEDPHLSQGDVRFEPRSALVSGADGLDDIRHIIAQSRDHLHAQGWLLLEHGYNQSTAVAQLFAEAQFQQIGHAYDLQHIPRVTFGCWSPH